MIGIIIEFFLVFSYLMYNTNIIADNNMLLNSFVIKKDIINVPNNYHEYLYNMYNDSSDNNNFEDQLNISGTDCKIDNNNNGTTGDNIDGCNIIFTYNEDKIYHYQGKLIDNDKIKHQYHNNKFNGLSYLTAKKYDDHYSFNIYRYTNGTSKWMNSFDIDKSR